jgi:hypothetical protein
MSATRAAPASRRCGGGRPAPEGRSQHLQRSGTRSSSRRSPTATGPSGTKNCYRHTDCRTAHIHAEVDRFIGMGWDFAKFDAMIVNELRVGRMSYQDSVYYVQRFQALTEGAVV